MNIGQESGIKNLLIIGHTNVGKSTLCNVLCDANDFEENDYTAKKTRNFQEKDFVWKETKYRVIEIGVSSNDKKDLYNKIGEVIYSMPEGISQVLFLVDERFMAVEISPIYVNNPPIKITTEDDDDKERVQNNKRTRARSRNILLNHLETTCKEKYYKLTTWDDLYNKIASVKSNGTGDIAEEVERSLIIESEKKNEKTQQTTKRKGRKNQKDQQWFDEKYSNEEVIIIVGRKRLNLAGSLKIEGFKNLKNISLKKLKIANLEINNCPQLNIINMSELAKLTSLSVTGCPKLIVLNCSLNELTSLEVSGYHQLNNILDLSTFTKLTNLYVRNYSNLTTLDFSSIKKLTSLKISGCLQLTNINNLSKSSKLESLSVIDCPKLTTLNYSTNRLTSLEIIGCKQLKKISNLSNVPKLTSLTLIDCPNITKLDCSSTEKLTELEASDLIELKCSNTSIKTLSVNLCPGIQILDCSNNDKLIDLDISNCSKLEFLDCSNSKLTSLGINNCIFLLKEYEQNGTKCNRLKYPSDLKIIEKRITKNLIIVGRIGGGKSTLFNILTESEDFEESGRSISVIKNFQKKDFEWHGRSFSVVDTIGVGDTQLSTKKVLYKVLDGIFSIPEGISQILFVIDERFTTEEVKIFNLLKGSIFDIFGIHIFKYVTIVRTKFSNFKNKSECEADKEQLHNENENIAKIVKSCRDIVYVDNPPTNFQIFDEDDQETVATNRRKRERSREVLLNYLDKTCQLDCFKLKTWDQIREPIAEYLESNCEDVPPELEKNQTLIKISELFCSIT
ncbi:unnamed protein product [Rhizophagus irregularis]|uniref:AIG1-type G domain-containing protein n=2 Tax=Rhizophagus irregularis TaxID=588596 RepID=A0A915ZC89_9GLOM|nr:unnamed protein product [Rhizophagus irregularis]CAB5208527.1 unnamed protein product [Rhizophagus irregularis]CAB5370819.1 unnamed protein product [Rhizophagus irregularis]